MILRREGIASSAMIQISHNLVFQLIAAISVSLASMVVGFVTGYTSPATDSMRALQSDYFPVSESAISWIGGIMPLSALIGGIVGGQLIDWRGRRSTIMITAPFFVTCEYFSGRDGHDVSAAESNACSVAASLLIAFAEDVSMILVGRAVEGVCVGILSLSLPVYLGETLRPEVRGTLGLLPTALGNTGEPRKNYRRISFPTANTISELFFQVFWYVF